MLSSSLEWTCSTNPRRFGPEVSLELDIRVCHFREKAGSTLSRMQLLLVENRAQEGSSFCGTRMKKRQSCLRHSSNLRGLSPWIIVVSPSLSFGNSS